MPRTRTLAHHLKASQRDSAEIDNYSDPKSYRPIGLLSVMGKILEKMIICRLKWHLILRISTRQYGFMPQKSTEDSLYDLVHHINHEIKQKKVVTVVSLDIGGF